MVNEMAILKAVADETRMKILTLLLGHNYCVGALSRRIELSEAAISQHLKVLREAGLLTGEKRGYFMHYDVNRTVLSRLAEQFKDLAEIEREACKPEDENCTQSKRLKCHVHRSAKESTGEFQHFCHGTKPREKRCSKNGHCDCH